MIDFIQFDRMSDALTSLEEFCDCVDSTHHQPRRWKFAIISIHNALQGYVCISLSNGSSFHTWKEKHLVRWLKAYKEGKQLPNPQLDIFMNLFDKLFLKRGSISRDDIVWLNEARNSFTHFNQDGYSLCHESAYICCLAALEAIKLTPTLSSGIFFYEDIDRLTFRKACENAQRCLSAYKLRITM